MKICANCGSQVQAGEANCFECGYVMSSLPTASPAKSFREVYKANLDASHRKLENEYLTKKLPGKLQSAIDELILPGEKIGFKLLGAFKEVLVCTDRRVIILKTGFMTGQFFGTNVFQLPYSQISSAQVEFHLASGFFQLSAGGVSGLPRSYWSTTKNMTPREACNCVSIVGNTQAKLFRDACSFIMAKISLPREVSTISTVDDNPYNSIVAIGKLLEQGLISREEFEAKKRELLSRL